MDYNEEKLSIEVYGEGLIRVGGLYVGNGAPAEFLGDCVDEAFPSGGALLGIEPDGDPLDLLDFEALEDYDPTELDMAGALKRINDEHELGLDGLVKRAELEALVQDDELVASWADEFARALAEKGYLVYYSDTRLEFYRFSDAVHEYVKSLCEVTA